MRLLVALSIAVSVLASVAAQAESGLDQKRKQTLVRLEQKFFSHGFEQDSDERRVSRIEELIYGEASPDSAALPSRIEKLSSLLPPEEQSTVTPPKKAANQKEKSPSSLEAAADRALERAKDSRLQSFAAENEDKPSTLSQEEQVQLNEYPHINDLETFIFGKATRGEPLAARVNALETKAFGSPSDIPDMSKRIDALDVYVEKKLHIRPYGSELSQQEIAQAGPPGVRSPAASQANEQAKSRSGVSKQMLATVANTLLGVSGFGGAFMPAGSGSGMGMGQGAGAGSMRFGGMRFSQKPAQKIEPPEDPDFDAAPHADSASTLDSGYADPNLQTGSLPPPETARLATKVSWCETQVFGRTYPELHLTDRLKQLSRELQCCAGSSDLQLMDSIGVIVKSAQLRQKTKPIGSVPESLQ